MIDIDPRYQNGKIYKIIGSGMRYYGSTIQTLNARLSRHEDHYKLWLEGKTTYCKSFDIIAKGDYEIKLVRLYPCNNRPELERKEGRYILKNECINNRVAGRTKKEYREVNKDKIREQNKAYYENNREKIQEQIKAYHETIRERLREYNKTYQETNREKIREYQNTIITCPSCGRTYTRRNKGQHEKTQSHKANV